MKGAPRLLLAALLLPGFLRAQEADSAAVVGIGAEGDTVTVGEPFRAGVLVRAPAGSTVELVLAEPADRAFQLAEPSRAYPADPPATHRAVATLVVWVVDPPATAAAEARVVLPDGRVRGFPVELPLPPVRAVLPADSAAPRDARDIVSSAEARAFPWGWVAAAIAALVLLAALWRWRRRRPGSRAAPLAPRARALAELEALRAAGLVEAGALDEFYARLSRIVRDFAAPEVGADLTTTEAVDHLRRAGAAGQAVERLALLLAGADLAKFARRPPSAARAAADWEAAKAWVEREPAREVAA